MMKLMKSNNKTCFFLKRKKSTLVTVQTILPKFLYNNVIVIPYLKTPPRLTTTMKRNTKKFSIYLNTLEKEPIKIKVVWNMRFSSLSCIRSYVKSDLIYEEIFHLSIAFLEKIDSNIFYLFRY